MPATTVQRKLPIIDITHPDYGAVAGQNANAALAAALIAAVDPVTRKARAAIYIPAGTYHITLTWILESIKTLVVYGDGKYASVLKWQGSYAFAGTFGDPTGGSGAQSIHYGGSHTTTSAALKLIDVSHSTFRGWSIEVNNTGDGVTPSLFCGVWSETMAEYNGVATNVFNTTNNTWEDFAIWGDSGNGYRYGWYFSDATHSKNLNNDLNIWRHAGATHYTDAGVYFGHDQSKQHLFTDRSGFSGMGSLSRFGIYCRHGSFHALHAGGGNNKYADIYMVNFAGGDALSVIGWESEESARLLEAFGVVGAGHSFTLKNVRFDPQNKLAVDNVAVRYQRAGVFEIENCVFGGDSTPAAGSKRGATLVLGSAGVICHYTVRNNTFVRDIAVVTDYNSPFTFAGASGSSFDAPGNSFGDFTSTPQNLSKIPTGSTFARAFARDTIYTSNTGGATSLSLIHNGWWGRSIRILEGDANTTIVHAASGANTIRLKGGVNLTPGWLAVDLVYDGVRWIQP